MKSWLSLLVLIMAASFSAAQTRNPVVIIDTSVGVLKVELFPDKAPVTVLNFLKYADERFYDGTVIHRVIRDVFIQGGGHGPDLKLKKTREAIKDESDNGLRHVRGTIGIARANNPKGGTSQFFINVRDNQYLDQMRPGYTVFGKVIAGMDVVDKIKQVPTGNRGTLNDVPVEDIVVRSIRRASHVVLELSGSGEYAVGKTFTLSAYVEYPIPGQFLTLQLPPGLERVEGKELQPVAADADFESSLVVWRVRGLKAGEFECRVHSSTGVVHTKKIKIGQ